MSKVKTYFLGYPSPNSKLKNYRTPEIADFESEEWCEVKAKTLKEAKQKYEFIFAEWQKSQNELHNKNRGTQRSPFGIGS